MATAWVVSFAALILPSTGYAQQDLPKEQAVADAETAPQQHAQNPETTESAESKVVSFRNLRYSDAEGDAGRYDLFLPKLVEDVFQDSSPNDGTAGEGVDAGQAALEPDPLPVRIKGPRRPAVVIIHGGGWAAGDKWPQGVYGKALARAGIVAMNINYRLAPEFPFPAAVDDVRTALLFLVDHADELAVDVRRIGLWGYSAGGHLAALVAAMTDENRVTQVSASGWKQDDPRWERLPQVRALCAGGAPCDFRQIPPHSDALAFFLKGPRHQYEDLYEAASPTAFASAGDPPTQLIHGDRDFLVPLESSRQFHRALQEAGVSSELSVWEGQGHMATFLNPKTKATVVEFLRNQLQPTTR